MIFPNQVASVSIILDIKGLDTLISLRDKTAANLDYALSSYAKSGYSTRPTFVYCDWRSRLSSATKSAACCWKCLASTASEDNEDDSFATDRASSLPSTAPLLSAVDATNSKLNLPTPQLSSSSSSSPHGAVVDAIEYYQILLEQYNELVEVKQQEFICWHAWHERLEFRNAEAELGNDRSTAMPGASLYESSMTIDEEDENLDSSIFNSGNSFLYDREEDSHLDGSVSSKNDDASVTLGGADSAPRNANRSFRAANRMVSQAQPKYIRQARTFAEATEAAISKGDAGQAAREEIDNPPKCGIHNNNEASEIDATAASRTDNGCYTTTLPYSNLLERPGCENDSTANNSQQLPPLHSVVEKEDNQVCCFRLSGDSVNSREMKRVSLN